MGENELILLYDNAESVCGIIYNETPFYFQKNLQGDIIAIANAYGQIVARYNYDAWGVCTIESDCSGVDIAEVNPYRYRGYYYDAEIGMYYLQSRYYDPEVGRFVNGDEIEIATFSGKVIYTNLFVYCENNPATGVDLYGNFAITSLLSAIDDALGFIMSIAETAVCTDSVFKKIGQKIKNAKTRSERKSLIKAQKKLLISGVGKELFYAAKIIGYIALIAPFIQYVLEWSQDKIFFVEFIVAMIIEIITKLLCKATSWLVGLIPTMGIMLGFAVSYVIEKMIEEYFSDSRISRIANYYNSRLSSLNSIEKWFSTLGYVLTI